MQHFTEQFLQILVMYAKWRACKWSYPNQLGVLFLLRLKHGQKHVKMWLKSRTVLMEKALGSGKHWWLFRSGQGDQPGEGRDGFQERYGSYFWGVNCSNGKKSTLLESACAAGLHKCEQC